MQASTTTQLSVAETLQQIMKEGGIGAGTTVTMRMQTTVACHAPDARRAGSAWPVYLPRPRLPTWRPVHAVVCVVRCPGSTLWPTEIAHTCVCVCVFVAH